MIVFGQAERRERTADKLAEIGRLMDVDVLPGIRGHEKLAAALIEAGELAQGLADDAFAAAGHDDRSAAADAAMALCIALAREVRHSWRGNLLSAGAGDGVNAAAAFEALASLPLPATLTVRQPEGFAHYAVYPEAFLEASDSMPTGARAHNIGVRSIGTTLAALVAASLPCASAPITVRPVGHPFRREIRLGPEIAFALAPVDEAIYVIADEGPGLSGSSVAAVASCLESRGVGLDRVHVVPSHAGEPGPEADAAIRRTWRSIHRHVRTFEDTVLGAAQPSRRLEAWMADLVGAPTGPLIDISGGGWRGHRALDAERWPPVHAWAERRKFLLPTETGLWLLKFAGLDRIGRSKAGLAATLAEGGFTPDHAGMRHGFVAERWHRDARALDPIEPDRAHLLRRLGVYLGLRSRACPAGLAGGASPEQLLTMAHANTTEALGEDAASQLEAWRPALHRLARRARPVAIDGRLHAWEWLVSGDRLLKTDALDHHAGHDLVGSQDIAWDIAGAAVEWDLSDDEVVALAIAVEREAACAVDEELIAFARVCYLAFQLGLWTFARASAGDDEEAARIGAAADRYRRALGRLLGPGCQSGMVQKRTIDAGVRSAK